MKKIPENRNDIRDILLEQVALMAEWNKNFGHKKPEQISNNVKTMLEIYSVIR